MKRIAVFAVLAASIMVVPTGASATTTCPTPHQGVTVGGISVGVTGSADLTPTARVTACVDNVAPSQGFHGGYITAGAVAGNGVFAIVDGDDANTFISTQGAGYFGISTYETSPPKGDCDSGSGTNSGGCFEIRDTFTVPVALPIACGNTTGPDWSNAGRDGCVVP